MSRVIRRAVVDLPEPDSPTSPSVSPGWMSNEISSTACTLATSRWKMIPRVIGKNFVRLRTLTSAPSAGTSGTSGCGASATLIRRP